MVNYLFLKVQNMNQQVLESFCERLKKNLRDLKGIGLNENFSS